MQANPLLLIPGDVGVVGLPPVPAQLEKKLVSSLYLFVFMKKVRLLMKSIFWFVYDRYLPALHRSAIIASDLLHMGCHILVPLFFLRQGFFSFIFQTAVIR